MIETYKRQASFASLKEYCHHSKADAFMEVTEWHNGEGYDILINSGHNVQHFSMTLGEMQLLQVLTNYRSDK